MANPLTAIRAQLVTLISAINGAGSYTHNLSGDDQVVYAVGEPVGVPCVMLFNGRWTSRIDDAAFGHYDRVYMWDYTGWVAAETELGHAAQAEALANDLSLALEADRDVIDVDNGQVLDILLPSGRVSSNEFDHEDLGGLGWVDGVIEVRVKLTTGM